MMNGVAATRAQLATDDAVAAFARRLTTFVETSLAACS
jgi:hypothetical protein